MSEKTPLSEIPEPGVLVWTYLFERSGSSNLCKGVITRACRWYGCWIAITQDPVWADEGWHRPAVAEQRLLKHIAESGIRVVGKAGCPCLEETP